MAKREMSAKDKAFEKERVKYRRQLREAESAVRDRDATIAYQFALLREKDERINALEERVNDLLSIIDRSPEDIDYILSGKSVVESFDGLLSIFGGMLHSSF